MPGVLDLWRAVASNDTGATLAAGTEGGKIYISIDFGSTWTLTTTINDLKCLTCQTVGGGPVDTKFAATTDTGGGGTGNIWTSADSGTTWTEQTGGGGSPPPGQDWWGIASDATGERLAAVIDGGNIWLSTNSGVDWTEQTGAGKPTGSLAWKDVASDSIGAVLVAVPESGNIWKSTNFGAIWLEDATVGTAENWRSVASNADGDQLAAVVFGGDVWTWPNTRVVVAPPTKQDLDMRRKAEILRYKKNNSNMSKKQLWARTIKGHGPNGNRTWATQSADGTYTNPNIDNLARSGFTLQCPGRPNNCAPTTNSDVPGKQMLLCMRPDIPLTNYIVNRTYLAGGTKWPQTAWKPGDNGFPVGKAGRNLVFR